MQSQPSKKRQKKYKKDKEEKRNKKAKRQTHLSFCIKAMAGFRKELLWQIVPHTHPPVCFKIYLVTLKSALFWFAFYSIVFQVNNAIPGLVLGIQSPQCLMVHYCHFLHFEFTFYLHCCKALHSLIAAVCRQNPGQLPLPIQRQQAFIQQGTVRCVQLAIAGNTQSLPGLCAPENCVAKSGKKNIGYFSSP